jgi:hypothetical protein
MKAKLECGVPDERKGEWPNRTGLNERNTFSIYDTDERGYGLEENLRLFSLMFAYVRLMGEK